jgi:hypothetical protein
MCYLLTCAFSPDIAGGLFHFNKDNAQYSLKPEDYATKPLFVASKENRFLNEFFLCRSVLQGHSQISCVCDDQYTATLERLETGDEEFKLYLTQKTQGWFRRWGCPCTSAAASASSPAPGAAPGAAPGGAGASTPAKDTARQTKRVVLLSSRRSGATAIRRRHQPCPWTPGDVAIAGPGVGHTPSKTSRVQSAAFLSSPTSSSTPRLCQAPLACAIGYTHIEIICSQNCVNVGIDCEIIGETIGEIMDVIICDIIGL